VFIDVEPDTFNMDPAKVAAAIKPGVTKAILAVSFHGQCPRWEALADVARAAGIPLLEDGAQSFGATRHGVPSCGPIPGVTASTTSFYPAKPLGCYGDGGAVFTSDDALAASLRAIRTYGGVIRDKYEVIGTNARLDTIQAAVLLVKLKYYRDVLARRRAVAAWYDAALAGSGAILPTAVDGNTHTYAQYTVRVAPAARAAIMGRLKDANIPAGVYYPTPLHLQKCYEPLGHAKGAFPVTEALSDSVLSIPIHQYVTKEQVDKVSAVLRAAIAEFGGALAA
jgi:UDP-2-acetamido-2-deoxy-ribo-hexuluronate aminotransferase